MTISKEHRANIEAAIKETEYKYFGMYEFTEAQHNAVDLLVSVAQAMLDDEAALESRVLAERKEPVAWIDAQTLRGFANPQNCNKEQRVSIRRADAVHCSDVPLFTHPTPDDADGPAITADVHADAARHRFMRSGKALTVRVPVKDKFVTYCLTDKPEEGFPAAYDAAIDAAMKDKASD